MGTRLRCGDREGSLRRLLAPGLLLLVIAACSGGEASSATTATPPVASPAATTTTTGPPPTTNTSTPPSQIDLVEGLPRTTNYAFVEVTIEAAAISAVEPTTFLKDDPVPADETYLYLTMHVANGSDRDGAIINPSPFSLLVDGVTQAAPIAVDGRTNLGLGPLAETDKVMAFAIPDGTTFDSMVLAVAQPDRIPAHLPLTGDVVDSGFPVALSDSGEGPAQGGASGCNQSLDITVFGGTAAIDLLDSDAYPTGYGSRRANIGDRFVSLDIRITNNGGSRCGAGSTNYSPDSFTLVVDGVARGPVTFISGAIAAGGSEDITVNFVYPTDATTVEFTVGDEAGTLFLLPIDVTAVPAEG